MRALNLFRYAQSLAGESIRLSWSAANGLLGAVLGGAAMSWRGVLPLVSTDLTSISNWALSFVIYAAGSWLVLFGASFIFVAPYRSWQKATQRGDAACDARILAEAKLVPKLQCSFAMDMPGCVVPDKPTHHLGPSKILTWYRLKVETVGSMAAHKCHGRLIALMHGGIDLLEGESPELGFSPADEKDTLSKTINPTVPEFLDFLTASKDNGVVHVFRGHLVGTTKWDKLFPEAGTYVFHVVVISEDAGTSECSSKFQLDA